MQPHAATGAGAGVVGGERERDGAERRSRSRIRCAWASIACAGVERMSRPSARAVPGMNCAIPCAPARRDRERVEAATRRRAARRAAWRRRSSAARRAASARAKRGRHERRQRRRAPSPPDAEPSVEPAFRAKPNATAPTRSAARSGSAGACAAASRTRRGGPRSSSVPNGGARCRAARPTWGRGGARTGGLLGVGAKAAHDDQRDAVARAPRRHAVERQRDVRPHRLALAERQRPVVLARPVANASAAAARARASASATHRRAAPTAADLDDAGSRTVTRMRDGANASPSGKVTSTRRAPLSRARRERPRAAAAR